MSPAPGPPPDPGRPPDWRWRLAAGGDGGPRPADPWVRAARRFRRALANCRTDDDDRRLAARMPDAAAAHGVYAAPDGAARDALEARVLAGEPPAEVARKAGLAPAAVAAYEALFFDVRDRLGSPDFVLARVVGPGLRAGGRAAGPAWKLLGYLGGPRVVDELVGGRPAGPRPASPDQVAAFLTAEARAAALRRLAAAGRAAGPDPRLDAGLVLGAARREGGGDADPPRGVFLEHVRALLAEIPWASGADAGGAVPAAVAGFDAGAGELRDEELLRVAAGQAPDLSGVGGLRLPEPRPRAGAGGGGPAGLP